MEKNTNRDPAAAQRAMGGGGASPIVKIRRDSGFYDNIPWDKVEYWVQEGSFYNIGLFPGPFVVLDYMVPPGCVIDLTSTVFRIFHPLSLVPWQHAALHDYALDGLGWFTLKVGGTSLYRNVRDYHSANPPIPGDIYTQLNQDIMVPQLPFHVIILPGQHIVTEIQYLNGVPEASFYQGWVTVEHRGLVMAKGLFDKLAREFRS